MIRQIDDKQKITFLIMVMFVLIFLSMAGFGTAVVYSMVRLQANIRNTYLNPIIVNKTGLDAYINLSRLHDHMLRTVLIRDSEQNNALEQAVLPLDKNLREDLRLIKTEYWVDAEKFPEIELRLNDWENIRMKMITLVQEGHRDQALKLATTQGYQIYSQIERNLGAIVASSQSHVEILGLEAKNKSAEIIRMVWWFLGWFIATCIFSGYFVIHKIYVILKQSKEAAHKLLESEERMKLALSNAEVGTWDLDVRSGNLDFDSQWGGMLDFISEKERPHSFETWATLIHPEDKDRVLNAMQAHIDGRAFEYKAEYRIYTHSGKLRWVVGHGRAVHRDANGKALRVVGVTRDITLQKQVEDTIWKRAHTDFLTELPNRSLFYDRLGQCITRARRQNKKFALLFLDLDDFKLVNDKLGHDAGDALLREVAERLQRNIRNEDTVARTGGDEFIFILTDVGNNDNVAKAVRKIGQSISRPFEINGHTCMIGSSIGISIFPDDSDEIEELVTQADNAMYKAKEKGKNNYEFYAAQQRLIS